MKRKIKISIALFSGFFCIHFTTCISLRVGENSDIVKRTFVYNIENKKTALIIISIEQLSKRPDFYITGGGDQLGVSLKYYKDLMDACNEVIKELNIFSEYKILFNFHSSTVKNLDALSQVSEIIPEDYVNLNILNMQFKMSKSDILEYKQLRKKYEEDIKNSVNLYDQIIYVNMQCKPLYDESNFYHNPSAMLGGCTFYLIPWWGYTDVSTSIIVYYKAKELKNRYMVNDREMFIFQAFLLPLYPFFTRDRVYKKIMHDNILQFLIKGNEDKIF